MDEGSEIRRIRTHCRTKVIINYCIYCLLCIINCYNWIRIFYEQLKKCPMCSWLVFFLKYLYYRYKLCHKYFIRYCNFSVVRWFRLYKCLWKFKMGNTFSKVFILNRCCDKLTRVFIPVSWITTLQFPVLFDFHYEISSSVWVLGWGIGDIVFFNVTCRSLTICKYDEMKW